jgi:hypothetical protein
MEGRHRGGFPTRTTAARPPADRRPADLEGTDGMLHFSCDFCSKDLLPGGADRFVVKMEAYPAAVPAGLTDDDLTADHVEEMARLLSAREEAGDDPLAAPGFKKLRFDLCRACYEKFLADPLGREKAEFDFSEN